MMIGSGWCENPDRVRAPGDGKVNIYGRKRILHRVNDTNVKPEEIGLLNNTVGFYSVGDLCRSMSTCEAIFTNLTSTQTTYLFITTVIY